MTKKQRPVSSGIGSRYPVEDFRRVVEQACRGNTAVRVVVPAVWARKFMPILSPEALRLTEIEVIPGNDTEFYMATRAPR